MRRTRTMLCCAMAAALAACSSPGTPNDGDGGPGGEDASTRNDVGGSTMGGGTCADPIDLMARGTLNGNDLVFSGSTAGMPNNLHPYGGCVMSDAEEVVFVYRVPAGVQAVRVSTEGSGFDTVLYSRDACSQNQSATDRACNNDRRDGTQQSTIFLTDLHENEVFYIIVDGSRDNMDATSSGDFTLTVTRVEPGTMGNPCRPFMEGSTTPRCNAPLGCSEGGGDDGSAICVPTVATGQPCDPTGGMNTCTGEARCAEDPTPPPDGMGQAPVCALPGTRAGTPCRMTTPRCDAPLVCGSGDFPVCVRVLNAGDACDPMGIANVCPMGTTCRTVDDAGAAECR